MSNEKDFVIKDSVLIKYVGAGGAVVIPEGVTEINEFAFSPLVSGYIHILKGRGEITSVVIPDSVKVIGESAFSGCKKLENIEFPESLIEIGPNAFLWTKWLKEQGDFVVVNNMLLKYQGNDPDVVIPDGIVSIVHSAFKSNEPQSMGKMRFLKSVKIPYGVKKIGKDAFLHCENLSDIDIPKSVEEIGSHAFYNTQWLNKQRGGFIVINNILYKCKSKAADIVIPDGIVSICGSAFSDIKKRIKSVSIPESVTRIDNGTFSFCAELKKITLPKNITTIEKNMFMDCSSLEQVVLQSNIKEIKAFAFHDCKKLTSINNLENVEHIDLNAFNGCKMIADDKGYLVIKDILFGYYGNEKILVIPENVKSVYHNLFNSDTPDIDMIYASENVFEQIWKLLNSKSKSMVALNCLTENIMYKSVQSYLKKNKEIIISDLIIKDEVEVFERMFLLIKKPELLLVDQYLEIAKDTVNIKAYLMAYKEKHFSQQYIEDWHTDRVEKELGFKERTAKDWKEIFKYSVADGIVRISGYKKEESVVEIPETIGEYPVGQISDGAFKGKSFVQKIILPTSIKNIGNNAFKGCTKLEEINIPDGVEEIGYACFEDCVSLTELILPKSVKVVYANAFKCCGSLKKLEILGEINMIPSYFADGCASLESLKLPDTVTEINEYAFRDCKKLIDISLPKHLENIWMGAFTNCRELTEIIIPHTVKAIRNYSFRLCKKLTNVYFSENTVEISSKAFGDCKMLTIHAPAGSYAEKYAKEWNIPFVAE